MVSYKASGIVLGNCWGGGQVGYPAKTLTADSLTGLVERINSGIKDDSLDSGMGFESLIGAAMDIETIDKREIDGKVFVANESEIAFFGDLSEAQQDFLLEVICC